MSIKRVPLRREAAMGTIAGVERFAIQAARRIVRLQEKRRRLRRELRIVDDELRTAKQQMRAVMKAGGTKAEPDTPMPVAVNDAESR